jgi:hypothetical protein
VGPVGQPRLLGDPPRPRLCADCAIGSLFRARSRNRHIGIPAADTLRHTGHSGKPPARRPGLLCRSGRSEELLRTKRRPRLESLREPKGAAVPGLRREEPLRTERHRPMESPRESKAAAPSGLTSEERSDEGGGKTARKGGRRRVRITEPPGVRYRPGGWLDGGDPRHIPARRTSAEPEAARPCPGEGQLAN